MWSVFFVGAAGTRWQAHVGQPSTIAGIDGAVSGQRERQLRHWHGKAEDKDEQVQLTEEIPQMLLVFKSTSLAGVHLKEEKDFLDLFLERSLLPWQRL